MAEGARLESVYTSNRIGGSNPFLSARFCWVYSDQMGNSFIPKGSTDGSTLQVSISKYPNS